MGYWDCNRSNHSQKNYDWLHKVIGSGFVYREEKKDRIIQDKMCGYSSIWKRIVKDKTTEYKKLYKFQEVNAVYLGFIYI